MTWWDRLLTDENVHPDVVAFLAGAGADVLDVRAAGLQGMPDEALLDRAATECRVVVTHDADFGRLMRTRAALRAGVLYLRPGHFAPAFHVATLRHVFAQPIRPVVPFTLVAHQREGVVTLRLRTLVP